MDAASDQFDKAVDTAKGAAGQVSDEAGKSGGHMGWVIAFVALALTILGLYFLFRISANRGILRGNKRCTVCSRRIWDWQADPKKVKAGEDGADDGDEEGGGGGWMHRHGVECNESRGRRWWAYGRPSERAVDRLGDERGEDRAEEILEGGKRGTKAGGEREA